ncbi:MAG: ArgE/DapE family deacylase [Bacillota bacterium]|nr:ArgE/DapE family deacylase [Bacillota bacterium]
MAVDMKLYEKASDMIKRDDMVKLLRELVNIKSPFFEEAEIIDYLRGRLSYYNRLETKIHHYSEHKITNFNGENLIVKLKGSGSGPKLLINAHVDTVPLCDGWTVDPYQGMEKDNRLYGLGSLDMKSGVVASVFLLEALVEAGIDLKGDIIFTAVSDEEGPFGLGTHYTIIDKIVTDCDYAIIPEPTGPFAPGDEKFPCIALGSRGTAVYYVEVKGKSAHGATPEKGINAIEDAARIITALIENLDLGQHPLLGEGTMCITNLRGGEKYLLVPEAASFTIYRHTVDGDADMALREVVDIVNSLNLQSEVKIKLRDLPHPEAYFLPWIVDEDEEIVQSLKQGSAEILGKEMQTTYFRSESDANHIASRLKIPTVIFGPDGANYHAADEYVEIDTMVNTAKIMLYTVLDLLT